MIKLDNCKECALRLYNTKHYNLHGYGNPWATNAIIVPNVDYHAYKTGDMAFSHQVNVIKSVLSFTGELSENLYIVPLIRCSESKCLVNEDIITRCVAYLRHDLTVYNWRNIMICGSAYKRLFNRYPQDDFKNIIYSVQNNRLYTANHNPLVMYTNEAKFKVFESRLIEWYNNSISNIIPNYDMLYL